MGKHSLKQKTPRDLPPLIGRLHRVEPTTDERVNFYKTSDGKLYVVNRRGCIQRMPVQSQPDSISIPTDDSPRIAGADERSTQ